MRDPTRQPVDHVNRYREKGDRDMKHETILAKAEQEKILAKLEHARARLAEMDAIARERNAQAVIDKILALRAKRDVLQTRIREFNDANEARALEIKAEVEKNLAHFEDEVSKLASKLKSQSATAGRR